jgi:hypothetical protein
MNGLALSGFFTPRLRRAEVRRQTVDFKNISCWYELCIPFPLSPA